MKCLGSLFVMAALLMAVNVALAGDCSSCGGTATGAACAGGACGSSCGGGCAGATCGACTTACATCARSW